MAAYVVADADWKEIDPAVRLAFSAAVRPVILAHGGHFLTSPAAVEPVEGDWNPKAITIIEMPSVDAARTLLGSDDFKRAARIRRDAGADFKLVLVDGV